MCGADDDLAWVPQRMFLDDEEQRDQRQRPPGDLAVLGRSEGVVLQLRG